MSINLKNSIFLILILIIFLGIKEKKVIHSKELVHVDETQKKDTTKIEEEEYRYTRIDGLPRKFDTVPLSGGIIYRSNQPTISQLILILENYPVKTIIRMNGEEGTGVSIDEEAKIAKKYGVNFYWINAHLGYLPGKGYTKSIDSIQPLLSQGNSLIHCTAGADRTGYQVAKYLQDKKGWDRNKLWEYTTKYNNWKKFICEGRRGYIKYLEAFYPYDLWKKNESSVCRNKIN